MRRARGAANFSSNACVCAYPPHRHRHSSRLNIEAVSSKRRRLFHELVGARRPVGQHVPEQLHRVEELHLKDKPEALVVQFVLLAASIAVMVLSSDAKAKKVKKA